MSTTTIPRREITVPKGSKPYVRRGTGEAKFHKRLSVAKRRAEDAQAVTQALAWMDLHGDEVDAPNELDQLSADLWDDDHTEAELRDLIDQDGLDEFDQPLPEFDTSDWYADLHGISDPFHTLTDEDLRDLTVTQMFWGDYTNDDREV